MRVAANFLELSIELIGWNRNRSAGSDLTAGNGLHQHAGTDKYRTTIPIMHPDSNLEMLMARYQQGDFAAATALIDRISPQLYRFFVGQFASRPDADASCPPMCRGILGELFLSLQWHYSSVACADLHFSSGQFSDGFR
jgi:hypothetical protein